MGQLDRRYIFLVMLIVVGVPFLLPFQFKAKPSEETIRFANALEKAIASEKPVIVGVDYGPQTMAEMEPILLGVMHKLFSAKKKVIFLTFLTETPALMHRYLADMEKQYDLTYGEDYVYLGYATPYYVAIYAMGTSIEEYFHADDRGTPIDEIPIMKGISNFDDISAVINIASNTLPQYWIYLGVAPFNINFLMACTATQATDYFPYIQTGQVKGLIAGGRAGAEYEGMLVAEGVLKETGDATRGLGSQSMALMAIIAFIIAGNVSYFAGRFGRRRENR